MPWIENNLIDKGTFELNLCEITPTRNNKTLEGLGTIKAVFSLVG